MRLFKMLAVVLIAVILIIVAVSAIKRHSMYYGSKGGKRIKMGSIIRFSFGASGGSYMNSGTTYSASLEDGKVLVRIRLDGIADEDAVEIVTDTSFLKRLDEIVERNNIRKWNGFSLSNKMVMDGDGFHLSIKMDNGEYLSASGYMAWPDGYSEFAGEVSSLFMELYPSD